MGFNFSFKKHLPEIIDSQNNVNSDFEFSKASSLFVNQRAKIGISLEDLSNKTKISKNVLLSIENGLENYLPEKTYLISMIKILEIELSLSKGSLDGLLTKKNKTQNNPVLKFKFINVDFLNTWKGSLLYFILMLISILALNSQQKYLIKINSLSTEPILMEDFIMK